MKNLKEVFAQQASADPMADSNIKEVAGVIERVGINTYRLQLRSTIYLAVSESDFAKAHDIVYRYWHEGKQV